MDVISFLIKTNLLKLDKQALVQLRDQLSKVIEEFVEIPETKKAETKKAETKKAETKKAETKKAETKKAETKKAATKKAATKKATRDYNETKLYVLTYPHCAVTVGSERRKVISSLLINFKAGLTSQEIFDAVESKLSASAKFRSHSRARAALLGFANRKRTRGKPWITYGHKSKKFSLQR
jgi:chromatin remodeling complex protein RSC6